MRLVMTVEEAALHATIGTRAFLAARAHVEHGDVVDAHWDADSGSLRGRLRDATGRPVTAHVVVGSDGSITIVDSECRCAAPTDCAHPAALVLVMLESTAALGLPVVAAYSAQAQAPQAWEAALAGLVDDQPGTDSTIAAGSIRTGAEIGLQFAGDLVRRQWVGRGDRLVRPGGAGAGRRRRGAVRRAVRRPRRRAPVPSCPAARTSTWTGTSSASCVS